MTFKEMVKFLAEKCEKGDLSVPADVPTEQIITLGEIYYRSPGWDEER